MIIARLIKEFIAAWRQLAAEEKAQMTDTPALTQTAVTAPAAPTPTPTPAAAPALAALVAQMQQQIARVNGAAAATAAASAALGNSQKAETAERQALAALKAQYDTAKGAFESVLAEGIGGVTAIVDRVETVAGEAVQAVEAEIAKV